MPNQNPQTTSPHPSGSHRKTVLAIASAGGHWIQLRRLHPAFEGTRLVYATTRETYRAEVEEDSAQFSVVPDCNRWQKIKLLKSALSIAWLIIKEKPDVIVTTGAAPGYFAIRIGKILGKKTIWVDSIANAEELSMSGQKAGKHVDLWITQWKHLERPEGPQFFGNVLGDEVAAIVRPIEPNVSPSGQSQQPAPHSSQSDEGSATSNHHKDRLKIFVTVGTDLPFDRLVQAIDNWAPKNPSYEIFAQIGETNLKPSNIPYCHFIEPPEFKKRFQAADIIISHAGMGTILSSLRYEKPLLVMPRIAAKGEHRNEHQLATANHLQKLGRVNVASDETKLLESLEQMGSIPTKERIGPYASATLMEMLKGIIQANA